MRATQHEELMREAGFEVERDRELASRRERRRVTRRRVSWFFSTVAAAALVAVALDSTRPHHRYVAAVILAVILTLVFHAVHWVISTWRALEKADRQRALRESRR